MSFQPKEACREMNSGKFFDSFKRPNLKFSEYEVEEGLIPATPPFVNKRKINIGKQLYLQQ